LDDNKELSELEEIELEFEEFKSAELDKNEDKIELLDNTTDELEIGRELNGELEIRLELEELGTTLEITDVAKEEIELGVAELFCGWEELNIIGF
jgi:hypothetical protein